MIGGKKNVTTMCAPSTRSYIHKKQARISHTRTSAEFHDEIYSIIHVLSPRAGLTAITVLESKTALCLYIYACAISNLVAASQRVCNACGDGAGAADPAPLKA